MAKRVPAVSYMVFLICGMLLYFCHSQRNQEKQFLSCQQMKLSGENGVDNVIAKLDKLWKEDKRNLQSLHMSPLNSFVILKK